MAAPLGPTRSPESPRAETADVGPEESRSAVCDAFGDPSRLAGTVESAPRKHPDGPRSPKAAFHAFGESCRIDVKPRGIRKHGTQGSRRRRSPGAASRSLGLRALHLGILSSRGILSGITSTKAILPSCSTWSAVVVAKRCTRAGDPAGPAGSMKPCPAGGRPVVAVEVLVEEDAIASSFGIVLELPGAAVDRTPTFLVLEEDARQPVRDFLRHLVEVHLPARAGGAFDDEVVAVVRCSNGAAANDEAVDGHPDRAALAGLLLPPNMPVSEFGRQVVRRGKNSGPPAWKTNG